MQKKQVYYFSLLVAAGSMFPLEGMVLLKKAKGVIGRIFPDVAIKARRASFLPQYYNGTVIKVSVTQPKGTTSFSIPSEWADYFQGEDEGDTISIKKKEYSSEVVEVVLSHLELYDRIRKSEEESKGKEIDQGSSSSDNKTEADNSICKIISPIKCDQTQDVAVMVSAINFVDEYKMSDRLVATFSQAIALQMVNQVGSDLFFSLASPLMWIRNQVYQQHVFKIFAMAVFNRVNSYINNIYYESKFMSHINNINTVAVSSSDEEGREHVLDTICKSFSDVMVRDLVKPTFFKDVSPLLCIYKDEHREKLLRFFAERLYIALQLKFRPKKR